jgi:hypothetical protein
MMTRATLLAALCALVAASGCGDSDGPPSSEQKPAGAADVGINTPTADEPAADAPLAADDKRGAALACIRDRMQIDAEAVGDKGIAVRVDGQETRIDFFQSSLEAEGEQFEGRAEGAEQIGAALFYVRELPEPALVAIEDCLNEQ